MPNKSDMDITQSKGIKYKTDSENFPELYVTFLDDNYYYVGVQTKEESKYHPFVILRNINIDAWGMAAQKDIIIPEIDCFDNRIIKYESLINSLNESVLDKCFNDLHFLNIKYPHININSLNRWFVTRSVFKKMSTPDSVYSSPDMPKELTIEYKNPCLNY